MKIFSRSLEKRGVKYTNYLGDGDTKGLMKVVEARPYGDTEIEKLECIGHIQKRMGTRLRRIVKDMKGKDLPDEKKKKKIGGAKRLTAQEIDNLQNYYGKAIRDNTNSVENMRRAIWATYFHKLSTDDRPLHNLCPPRGPGTKLWCKYNNEPSKYKHHGLPEEVMLAIKPIYRDLSHPDLLKSVCMVKLRT